MHGMEIFLLRSTPTHATQTGGRLNGTAGTPVRVRLDTIGPMQQPHSGVTKRYVLRPYNLISRSPAGAGKRLWPIHPRSQPSARPRGPSRFNRSHITRVPRVGLLAINEDCTS